MSKRFTRHSVIKASDVIEFYLNDHTTGHSITTACVSGSEAYLTSVADCLNEHMPPPKKTVEEFLAMSDEELDSLVRRSDTDRSGPCYAGSPSVAWTVLRPEIRKRGYWIDVYESPSGGVSFTIGKGDFKCREFESTTVTLARFLCACFLFVMQEEGAK